MKLTHRIWIGVSGIDGIRQDTWPYVPRWFWRDWMNATPDRFANRCLPLLMANTYPDLMTTLRRATSTLAGASITRWPSGQSSSLPVRT